MSKENKVSLVGENRLSISEAAVSQHLQILRKAGLVTGEKRGYWTHYSVDKTVIRQIAEALMERADRPPALNAADLKTLGIRRLNVLISHNHYDHLDRESIASLPDDARFYVPLGLKAFIMDLGKKDVIEMDWWQKSEGGRGTEVVCLPMQHWSRRIGQDFNTTLWASFMIITPSTTVYFVGDSGYFIGYREIGRLYPDIDYVLMPTTAYLPRWFMHYAHMDVDEAIDAFEDLKARFFIPTQWGAFQLGDMPPGYPALDLRRRMSERKLDQSRFFFPNIGEAIPIIGKTR